jgi:hypothetical protein
MPVVLPDCVRSLLWDTDPAAVGWESSREFLIGRILAHGDWDALRWLRRTAGDDALREWILARRGRALSPQQLRFWQALLDLPADLVTSWLAAPERQVWDRRCG